MSPVSARAPVSRSRHPDLPPSLSPPQLRCPSYAGSPVMQRVSGVDAAMRAGARAQDRCPEDCAVAIQATKPAEPAGMGAAADAASDHQRAMLLCLAMGLDMDGDDGLADLRMQGSLD